VPLLIGTATALFAFSGNVRRWILRHDEDATLHSARADRIGSFCSGRSRCMPGILARASASCCSQSSRSDRKSDFRTVNALKNLLSGTTGVVGYDRLHREGDGRVAADPCVADRRADRRLRRADASRASFRNRSSAESSSSSA
jgi:hypothetical protein